MKCMVTKFEKTVFMILLSCIILFQTFYYDYTESKAAMELGFTIALEDALLYLLGLCGITLGGAALADGLSQTDKEKVKEAFDEGCQQANISKQEQIAWEQKLCEGVLDKTSECWKAFLDSISTSHNYNENIYVGSGGISVGNFISNFKTTYISNDGKTFDIDLSKVDLGNFEYLMNENTCILSHYLAYSYGRVYLTLCCSNNNVPIDKYPEFYTIGNGSEIHYVDSSYMTYYSYEFTFVYDKNTGFTKGYINSDRLSGKCSINDRNLICDRPLKLSDGNYMEFYGDETVPTFEAYSHWSDIGVFNGDRTLSDVFNLINSNALSDTGVVNIPWENVSEIPIPMPGDTSADKVGHLNPEIEKLWEKLAAGEITWEQFIDLLQDAVGVITLEGVVPADVPVEGDLPIVVEQEIVPNDPDKPPRDKDDIIEENVDNTGYTFDLKEIFPFCIPFDLYNVISYLNVEPVAPCFEIPFPSYDTKGNLTMKNTITVDLSVFEPVALVFRVCIFILFVIGLILITRNLIRG